MKYSTHQDILQYSYLFKIENDDGINVGTIKISKKSYEKMNQLFIKEKEDVVKKFLLGMEHEMLEDLFIKRIIRHVRVNCGLSYIPSSNFKWAGYCRFNIMSTKVIGTV